MTDDRDFDRMVEEELTQLPPPERAIREITPWRRAVSRVVWGLGLSTCTLRLWNLDFLMTAVGVVLLYLGFRTLRRENRWFTACWAISLYRLAAFPVRAAVAATVWGAEAELLCVSVAEIGLSMLQLFCLWRAVKAVRRAAGQAEGVGAVAALMVFCMVMLGLGLIKAQGLLLVGTLLVIYGLILRSLSKIPALLDGAEYRVSAAPVRLPEGGMWLCWLGALAVCLSLAGLLWGRYPMDWSPRPAQEQAGLEDVRARLLALGMPDYVLDDLTGEEVSALDGAVRVEVSVDGARYDAVGLVEENVDLHDLVTTDIAVELPDGHWRVIHHFRWRTDMPAWGGTECIKLWPAYQNSGGWRVESDPAGRVLCGRGGVDYAADFYLLEEKRYTADSPFWGRSENNDLFAAFSMPLLGENRRGYLIYGMEQVEKGWLLGSWMNYTYQVKPVNYPLMTAMQYDMSGALNGTGAFYTFQSAVQFYPDR